MSPASRTTAEPAAGHDVAAGCHAGIRGFATADAASARTGTGAVAALPPAAPFDDPCEGTADTSAPIVVAAATAATHRTAFLRKPRPATGISPPW